MTSRAGPESAHHSAVLVSGTELAGDGLDPEDQADQCGDRPEPAQGDRLGLDGELHLGHDTRGHVELVGRTRRDQPDDLLLHRSDVTGSMVELESVQRRRSRRWRHRDGLFDECRGQHHEPIRPVDVVLDHPVVEDDDPRQPGPNSQPGRDASSAEARQIGLCVGVETEGHDLADLNAEDAGRRGGHDNFVSPVRIGQLALDGGQSVLAEEHAVGAAADRHVIRRAQSGAPFLASGMKVGPTKSVTLFTSGRWASLAANGVAGPPPLGMYTDTVMSDGLVLARKVG